MKANSSCRYLSTTTSSYKKASGKNVSSTMWLQRHMNDPYVRKAAEDGYRARSAYKLLEINKELRYRLFSPGMAVVECGCAPGAWSQVAAKAINAGGFYDSKATEGIIIGCDLLHMMPINGMKFIQGDFTKQPTVEKILQLIGNRKFDVVLSDMAPNSTGISQLDHDQIVTLSYNALRFACLHSYPGSYFVCKIWDGASADSLLRDIGSFYKASQKIKPPASRKDSAELYLVGTHFRGLEKK